MNQQGQKMIAGAIVVLAGTVLFAAGVVADALRPINQPQKEHESFAVIFGLFAGMVLGVVGFVIVFWAATGIQVGKRRGESE